MNPILRAIRLAPASVSPRSIALFTFALMATLLPSFAAANEGEHIVLSFDHNLSIGIMACLVIGVIALGYGMITLRSYVLAQSPGDEKMQEVGLAIRDGAMAYLKKQIATMSIFVVILFLGLVGLYYRMGIGLALGVGVCFVCGVVASYVSGYTGMLMAVAANMRTANAALSGYRTPLLVAFRSGGVAGLVTVGIGLIGASTILLAFPAYATNLLVGFGFGASLAALFMRVGGGIFTKAADVGADLVGKVEQGIPEDDPRNPAVIADNVGDNVGDCAGMAADVFESYEVTLVASIILGAASAIIFDAQTWPRLIVFGLAASAIGLLASLIGIATVKGSDDAKADPLKALNAGFYTSAVLAVVLTGVLAFVTMGGIGPKVLTTQLKPIQQYAKDEVDALKSIQQRLATAQHKAAYEITVDQILADPEAKSLGFDPKNDKNAVFQLINQPEDTAPKIPDLQGLNKVTNLNDPNNPVLSYAVRTPQTAGPGGAAFETLSSAFQPKTSGDSLVVFKLHHVAHIPPRPAQGNQPATTAQDVDTIQWGGPVMSKELDTQLEKAKADIAKEKTNESFDVIDRAPVDIYASSDGRIALGVEDRIDHPEKLRLAQDLPSSFMRLDSTKMNAILTDARNHPGSLPGIPQTSNIEIAVVRHATVPWWAFWLTLSFGVLMAFAIQYITDYYVSTHKAPTKEVAGVATAGAAPMVIQGFAHALTSSVFMVLAIVVALIFPLFVFNPTTYGGYTLSYYGIALVGLGLLTATAYVLAMDTFGPISDNAQGVFEMSGNADKHPEAAKVVARLDAAGNTTKALTKGFAIATAVVAAVALFHSYLDGAHLSAIGLRLDVPEIFLGLLIGGAAPYLFSAFAINAVGRSSFELINEVRRQLREDAGIMKGTSKPDYARCVAIVTAAAQKELLAPGILAIALPAAVGFGFSIGKPPVTIGDHTFNLTGAEALGGFLAGAIVSGQLLAVLLANAGGMWDNAKKLIEDGLHGGKGTDAHKAAVVGDTIGDPFKDTAGPALNPLIKVMNLVALLLSGVIILPLGNPILIVITAVCLLALGISISIARKGSMSEALEQAYKQANDADDHFSSADTDNHAASVPQTVAAVPVPAKRKLYVEEEDTPPTP